MQPDALLAKLRVLIDAARPMLYWRVGQRAGDGEEIVSALSAQLLREYGKGCFAAALTRMGHVCRSIFRGINCCDIVATIDVEPFYGDISTAPAVRARIVRRTLLREKALQRLFCGMAAHLSHTRHSSAPRWVLAISFRCGREMHGTPSSPARQPMQKRWQLSVNTL